MGSELIVEFAKDSRPARRNNYEERAGGYDVLDLLGYLFSDAFTVVATMALVAVAVETEAKDEVVAALAVDQASG